MIELNAFPLIGSPCVVGTGLIAMDVLVKQGAELHEVPFRYAGGTCGNVLTILAWLGWRAVPVARLTNDGARKIISADLQHFGVSIGLTRLHPRSSTPIIIEKLRTTEGRTDHHFSLNCPTCGSWLPRYQPVTLPAARSVIEAEPTPSVFFFDRASPGAVFLAESFKKSGSLIVFEPSGKADERLQKKALSLAHICKYSAEQFSELYRGSRERPLLEIQTTGSKGLKFRRKVPGESGAWERLDALRVGQVKDSAGAGDWLTAGLVFRLGQKGLAGFRGASQEDLRDALKLGQALAAWNCQFEGARGGMYAVSAKQFRETIGRLLVGKDVALESLPCRQATGRKRFRCSDSTCRNVRAP